MRTFKGPVTTELPDWEDLYHQYLDQQDKLGRLIASAVERGENPDWLRQEMLDLQQRLGAVSQMRQITRQHQAA